MRNDDLAVLAVLAHPDGDRFVDAPASHEAMNLLKQQARAAGEKFYCATQLDGCGQEVIVANGTVYRPHFRHLAGSRACALTPAMARDAYTHRAIQNALVRWLQNLGYPEAAKEKRVGPGSRVDVHCHPDAVIEVQLSPETDDSMQARTVRYGGNVTWLYDPRRPITSRDATLARDELVTLVQLDPADRPADEPQPVQIGIQTIGIADQPGVTLWAPLEDCTFTPTTGLQHPDRGEAVLHVATAKEAHRQAVVHAEEMQRQAAAVAVQLAADRRAEGQRLAMERYEQQTRQLAKRREPAGQAKERTDTAGRATVPIWGAPAVKNGPSVRHGFYPVVWSLADLAEWEKRHHATVPAEGAWVRVLRYYHDLFPDWAYQLRDQWAAGLPEELIDPAWATLYLLSTSLSGQVGVFIDAEVDTDGTILRHLHKRGLISLDGEPPDPLMIRLNQRVTPDPGRPKQHPVWNAY